MNNEQIKAIIEVVYHEYMYKYTGVEADSPEGKQNISSIFETVKHKMTGRTCWYDEEPNEPEPTFDNFVTFKGKKYPLKSLTVHFIEDDYIKDINVATEELEDALDDSVEARMIDENIYFYLCTLQFKLGQTVQLDQPVKILSVNK